MTADEIMSLLQAMEHRLDHKLARIERKVDQMNGRVRKLERWQIKMVSAAEALRLRSAHTYRWWTLAAVLTGASIGGINTLSNLLSSWIS